MEDRESPFLWEEVDRFVNDKCGGGKRAKEGGGDGGERQTPAARKGVHYGASLEHRPSTPSGERLGVAEE